MADQDAFLYKGNYFETHTYTVMTNRKGGLTMDVRPPFNIPERFCDAPVLP